jgi:catechol 2,3-dioxygenase-like lactoylglutathione lyase family enzyme
MVSVRTTSFRVADFFIMSSLCNRGAIACRPEFADSRDDPADGAVDAPGQHAESARRGQNLPWARDADRHGPRGTAASGGPGYHRAIVAAIDEHPTGASAPQTSNMSVKLVPELMVSSLAASLDFYIQIIGFAVRYDRPAEKFAYLDLDGAELMIEEETDLWETAPRVRPYGRGVSLQIEANDLDSILDRLKSAGIPLFRSVEVAWYRAGDVYAGNRQFLVEDPDGYLLRFFENLGKESSPSSGRIVG